MKIDACCNLSITYYPRQRKFLQEIRIEGHSIERISSTVAQQCRQIPPAGGRGSSALSMVIRAVPCT